MRRKGLMLTVGLLTLCFSTHNVFSETKKVEEVTNNQTSTSQTKATAVAAAATTSGSNPMQFSATTVTIDPYSGSASTSLAISTPPGRNGISPNITIAYNSSINSGLLGVGWMLDLGSIQRSTKRGVPQYTTNDIFILMQNGSPTELIYDTLAGVYRPEIEGAFMKIEQSANRWIVTDRKGVKYYFGSDASSQVYDPSNSGHIFRWQLDRVEDLSGNYMTITYSRYDNQLYPQQIDYTGNSQNNSLPYAKLTFNYEGRFDVVSNYMSGFEIKMSKRLNQITTEASNNLYSKYRFNYSDSLETRRSLLTSVIQYGSDGTSTLPPINFTYSKGDSTFDSAVNLANYPNLSINSNLVRIADMNGDGLVDLVETRPGNYKIYFNNGNGDFNSAITATNSPTYATDNLDIRFVDFNGDGLLDVVFGSSCPYQIWTNNGVNGFNSPQTISNCPPHSINHQNLLNFVDMNGDGLVDILDTYQTYKIYFNNGNVNFNAPVSVSNAPPYGTDNLDIRLVDFNGDGLLDMVFGSSCPYQIWTNNGVNGFNPPKTISNCPPHSINHQSLLNFVDMNGDGLVDILETYEFNGSTQNYKVYLNNGNVDFLPGVYTNNSPIRGTGDTNLKLVDLNADNLVDVLLGFGNGGGWQVWLNNGIDGFNPPVAISQHHASASIEDWNIMLADINGDYLSDMLYGSSGELPYKVWKHRRDLLTSRSDVLINMNNSIGGSTELEYGNSPVKGLMGGLYRFAQNTFLLNTVKKNKVMSALGDIYPTSYEYRDGLWNPKEKEFRGFRSMKTIDALGNYVESVFLQDDIYKGRLSQETSYDATGKVFSKVLNTWNYQTIATGSNFVFLKFLDRLLYDGNATGRRTREEYVYGEAQQLGNLTKMIEWGEINLTTAYDVGTDKRTVEMTYLNNTGSWVLGVPQFTIVRNNSEQIIRKSWFYYDGNDNVTIPTKGLLTKKETWDGSTGVNNLFLKYAYDNYGNLTTTTDAKNNMTTVIYDAQYQSFPIRTQNALGHQINNEYYGISGVALDGGNGFKGMWGQLKSSTDPNQKKGQQSYDTFGRAITAVSALDSTAYPTVSMDYQINTTFSRTTTRQRVAQGKAQTIDAYEFSDGMGRPFQSKRPSANPGQYIVNGRTVYDGRGLPIKKYLPFLSSDSINTLEFVGGAMPYAAYDYDAMGRVIKTTNPDGTYSSTSYDDWTTTTIDENGHMQKSYSDAYGRLIKKEEYRGSDGRSPNYPASAFTLYATTEYIYDSEGNLIQTKDAQGNIATIAYDNFGRKVSMNDPDMGIWKYEYDVNGNLLKQTDAKGQVIDFSYDKLNRLIKKTDHANLNVDYTYDDNAVTNSKGRLTKAKYSLLDNTAFEYDPLGRETKSMKAIADKNFEIDRNYNALGALTNLQYSVGQNIVYGYNEAGQIKAVATDVNILPATIVDTGEPRDNFGWNLQPSPNVENGVAAKFNMVNTGIIQSVGAWFASNPTIAGSGNGTLTVVLYKDLGVQIPSTQLYSAKMTISSANNYNVLNGLSWTVSSGNYWVAFEVRTGDTYNGRIEGDVRGVGTSTPNPLTDEAQLFSGQYYEYDAYNIGVKIQGVFSGTLAKHNVGKKATILLSKMTSWIESIVFGVQEAQAASLTGASAYWPLDETSGTTVTDGSGTGNNGTNLGATIGQSGKINLSYNFNGTSAYVNAGTNTSLNMSAGGAFTYAMWVKTTDGYGPILSFRSSTDAGVAIIDIAIGYDGITNSSGKIMALVREDGGSSYAHVVGNTINNAQWHHVALTRNSTGTIELFLDGVSQGSQTSSGADGAITTNLRALGSERFWVSSNYGTADQRYLVGNVDDAQIYKRQLSLSEIKQLAGTQVSIPAAPILNSATASNASVNLSWSSVANATGYKIKYGTTSANYINTIDVGNVTSYNATSLVSGTTYYFVVSAYNTTGESGNSNEQSATPISETPILYIKNVEYNINGQATKIEYGNGVVTTYTFNPLNLRLTRLYTVNAVGVVLQDLNYIYDSIGNILKVTDNVNTATQTFKYDELNRLVEAIGQGYGTKQYVYDTIGNITQKDGVGYYYGEGNAGPHAVSSLTSGTTFSYDVNGNMTAKVEGGVTTQYSYDVENRLTRVDRGGKNIALYEYDGDGGRTKTIVNGEITNYIGSLYEETSTRKTKYIFLGDTRVAAVTNSQALYYHADHLGGTNVLTDGSGVKKELMEYDPYGQFSRHEKYGSSEEVARFYFTGKKLDDESGLFFYGARYYDPKLGRFITADTVVQAPNNPQTLNRYSYVLNNPLNRIDPTGHWSWKSFWNSFAGAVVGAVVTVATGGLGAPAAFALGGAAGGAVAGGLNGGLQGALMGGLMGGVLGGGVGLGISTWGANFGYAALAAGGGYAIGTGHADSFIGGVTGGIVGTGIGSFAFDGIFNRNSNDGGIRSGTDASQNENWEILGVNTTNEGALAHANANQSSVFYVRSRGFGADMVRAGMEKVGIFGRSLAQRQLGSYLRGASGKYIFAHSEGTLLLAGAAKSLSVDGVKLTGTTFSWNAPVIMQSTANNLASSVGVTNSQYNLNWNDPIGVFTTFNPFQAIIYGVAGAGTLATHHGGKYYNNQ